MTRRMHGADRRRDAGRRKLDSLVAAMDVCAAADRPNMKALSPLGPVASR
jgi:hypothetical protein